ncbi:formyltransferase family protein [uncultured Microscilla sp.]|uniref:methionyl-tRNA formyltransferase n=1 Tax=uncultured Microscilla sp. TaxID=432653 RepID=UPI0026333785|nr:formyltransferase family protein [uncultured Microscilla sp.]
MNIAIIGRHEVLYNTIKLLADKGFNIGLIVTTKASPEYRIKEDDFEKIAQSLGAEFFHTSKINSPEFLSILRDRIKKYNIQVAVSSNYANLISQDVIDLFPLGILNAHGGDLPRYRGNACQAWAIINQEEKIGLCIHKMVGAEVDAGDIIARKYLPIDINTRVGQAYEWMEKVIPVMFLEALSKLQENPTYVLAYQSENPKDALRCYPRNPDDGKIDWSMPNDSILRLINASSEPFNGAFCQYKGEKIIIWRAEIYQDEEVYLAMPGQVALLDKNSGSVTVICGQGKLKITEVQLGDRRDSPFAFIKSFRARLS